MEGGQVGADTFGRRRVCGEIRSDQKLLAAAGCVGIASADRSGTADQRRMLGGGGGQVRSGIVGHRLLGETSHETLLFGEVRSDHILLSPSDVKRGQFRSNSFCLRRMWGEVRTQVRSDSAACRRL